MGFDTIEINLVVRYYHILSNIVKYDDKIFSDIVRQC